MKLYCIELGKASLFYDGKYVNPLSQNTKFYLSWELAQREVDGTAIDGYEDLSKPLLGLANDLTWKYLEKEKGCPAQDINISKEEFNKVLEIFSKLRVRTCEVTILDE